MEKRFIYARFNFRGLNFELTFRCYIFSQKSFIVEVQLGSTYKSDLKTTSDKKLILSLSIDSSKFKRGSLKTHSQV